MQLVLAWQIHECRHSQRAPQHGRRVVEFENNYFILQMCSGSEAGSYFTPTDFVYHANRCLRVIRKKKIK